MYWIARGGAVMSMPAIVYDQQYVGCVGIEQEMFLVSSETGMPVARSPQFLQRMMSEVNPERWTFELSACQVEYRTHPQQSLHALEGDLFGGHEQAAKCARSIGCCVSHAEVAPASMPLTVYYAEPRYKRLAVALDPETLLSACRVAGIHIHYGCSSLDHAIMVHNRLVPYLDMLCQLGDHSDGERIRLYKQMAPVWEPMQYQNAKHFERVAREQGFWGNLKNCWHLIRISRHGTVELRMFGNTPDIREIIRWAELVKKLIEG